MMWLRFNLGKRQNMPNVRVVNIYREMKSHKCAELGWQKLRLTIVARRHIFRAHSLTQPVLYSVCSFSFVWRFPHFYLLPCWFRFPLHPNLCVDFRSNLISELRKPLHIHCANVESVGGHHQIEKIERTKYFRFFFIFSTSVFVSSCEIVPSQK